MTEQDRITAHVAGRIRERRVELGLSQGDVAELLGVSVQMISRRELGRDKVNAAQLYLTAQALRVGVTHFYCGLKPKKD